MDRQPYRPDLTQTPGRGNAFRQLVDRKSVRKQKLSLADGDWQQNAQHLAEAIDGGLGVLLACTQDGGAISMTVYQGQNRFRSYAANEVELNELFEALAEHTRGS